MSFTGRREDFRARNTVGDSPVRRALFIMSEWMAKDVAKTLAGAARHVRVEHEALYFEALDILGSWPSSEPALRALQSVAWV